MGVYDIATGKWSTITNPLGDGTGDITAAGGLLYLVDALAFVSYDPATEHHDHAGHASVPLLCVGRPGRVQGHIYGQQGDDETFGFARLRHRDRLVG